MHYLLKVLKSNMQNSNSLRESLRPRFNSNGTYNYDAAIDALNSLQSNVQYLRNRHAERAENNSHEALRQNCIGKMEEFLNRSNIEIKKLKSIIHVAGTKGKGSTCAFCESILRQHGYKTGFYSSPHLTNVTERIRINGKTIDNQKFAQTFWEVYLALVKAKDNALQMPIYFQMLTLVAFKMFLQENVDVAIVEVGIGGEYDSTNVIGQSDVVGITSLGLDHTSILGDTIEKIAWHKAGIMKKGCKAFSAPQCDKALNVLKERSSEIECTLEIINPVTLPRQNIMPTEIFELNASLATKMADAWLSLNNQQLSQEKVHQALINCHWPGRFQIIRTKTIHFFLDGAHTAESLNFCADWYIKRQHSMRNLSNMPQVQKCLIFNSTGDRNVGNHLQILHRCGFHRIYFVPNVCKTTNALDNISHNFPESEQLMRCSTNKNKWCELFPNDAGNAYVLPSVNAAYEHLIDTGGYNDVLITGSLHLVGSALQALANMNNKIINAVRYN